MKLATPWKLAFVLATMMTAPVASACTVLVAEGALPFPAGLSITPSRSVLRPLTDWTPNRAVGNFTSCSGNQDSSIVGLPATGRSYVEGGQTYSIYPTGVPGIGIIYQARPNRTTYAWQSVEAGVTKTPWVNTAPAGGMGWGVQMRLIELEGLAPGNYTIPQQMQMRVSIVPTAGGTPVSADMGRGTTAVAVNGLPGCTVDFAKGRVINLGDVSPNEIPTIGATSRSTELGVSALCEGGLMNIYSRYGATTSIVDAATGRIALEPGGAQGVQVQLVNVADMPVGLDVRHRLGGSPVPIRYDLGLAARVYRDRQLTSPGAIRSGITITFEYD